MLSVNVMDDGTSLMIVARALVTGMRNPYSNTREHTGFCCDCCGGPRVGGREATDSNSRRE